MVTHADRVRIGEPQAQLATNLAMVLDDRVSFAADILCGGLDVRPNASFESFSSLMIDHGWVGTRWQIAGEWRSGR